MPQQIGWKFKPGFEKYSNAAASIIDEYQKGWWKENADNNLKNVGYIFSYHEGVGESAQTLLDKAEVLDKWFEPVFNKPTYKEGDWVLVKHTGEHIRGFEGMEMILQISYYKRNPHEYQHSDGTIGNGGLYQHYICFNNGEVMFSAKRNEDYIVRHATPEEIKAQYKVGDWVYIEGCTGSMQLDLSEHGDIVQIQSLYGGDYVNFIRNKKVCSGSDFSCIKRKATQQEIKQYQIILPIINGYNCGIEGNMIKYGCVSTTKQNISELVAVMTNSNIIEVKLENGHIISYEDLFELNKALSK